MALPSKALVAAKKNYDVWWYINESFALVSLQKIDSDMILLQAMIVMIGKIRVQRTKAYFSIIKCLKL